MHPRWRFGAPHAIALLAACAIAAPRTVRLETPFGNLGPHRSARVETTTSAGSGSASATMSFRWKKDEALEVQTGGLGIVVTPDDTILLMPGGCISLKDTPPDLYAHDKMFVGVPTTADARRDALASLKFGTAEPVDLVLDASGEVIDGVTLNRYKGTTKGFAVTVWLDRDGVVRRQEALLASDAGDDPIGHILSKVIGLDEDFTIAKPTNCTPFPGH